MYRTLILLLVILVPSYGPGESEKPQYKPLLARIVALPEHLRLNERLPKKSEQVENPKALEQLLDYLEKCVQRGTTDFSAPVKVFAQIEKDLKAARADFEIDEERGKAIRGSVMDPSFQTEKMKKAFAQLPSRARKALNEAESKKSTYLLVLTGRIPAEFKENAYLKGGDASWVALVAYLSACEGSLLPRKRGSGSH